MTLASVERSLPGRVVRFAAAFSLLLGGVPAGIAQQAGSAASPVRIGGSSTVHPIIEEAIRDFRKANPAEARTPIQLSEEGTTGGFRRFCQGQLLIAAASRPINTKEIQNCSAAGVQFIEVPIAFDAITVVVNPRNTWARLVTTRELARMWGRQAQGRINRWNQVNIDWPDRPLRLCGPGRDSGTYDMFNKVISGDAANARQDVVSSEDDLVLVKCVASDPNAIGYFGYSYYATNRDKLKALSVVGSRGPVAPSAQTVQNETYLPLSRPLFLYVNDKALLQSDPGRRFLNWTMRNGLRLTEEAGLIPLPPSTYRLAETKLYRRVLGTAFGGDMAAGEGVGQTLRRSLDSVKRPQYR
jgi:phosphate transport system substrate-binding protein